MEMMPQQEDSTVRQRQTDPNYGKYEGTQTSDASKHYEAFYEQEVREGPSAKVYPLPRDRTNTIRLALVVISLVLLVLFGFLFVVVVGGATGTISFAAACFVICCLLAFAATMRPSGH